MIPGSQAVARLAIAQNSYPVFSAYIAEAATLSEVVSAVGNLTYAVVELVTLVDDVTVDRVLGGFLSETLDLTDAILVAPSIYEASLIDAMQAEEALTFTGSFHRYIKVNINGMGWNYQNTTFYTWLVIDTQTGDEIEVSAGVLNERTTVE